MGGEYLFHIIQPLRGRGAEHHIVRLGDPCVNVIVAKGFAAKLSAVLFQPRLVDIEGSDDAAAQLYDRPAVGVGDIACADHQYVHRHFLSDYHIVSL